MYEIGDYLRHRQPLPTAIQEGRDCYHLVGAMPIELTEPYTSGFTTGRKSKTWKTLEEAIKAVLSTGITKFQLPDCSWYGK